MKWRKLGFVWRPSGERWWARQYAHLPCPTQLDGDTLRVYFASLDENKFGRLGSIDLDARDPLRVLAEVEEPLLDMGELGTFDDCGVVPSCFAEVNGRQALYYNGFQRAERVPYMLFTGLASRDPDTGKWIRAQRTPVLDRTDCEPFLRSAPSVLREGDRYRAWYNSARAWTEVNGIRYPQYNIRHAVSADGVRWSDGGCVCIELNAPEEFGLGRPWVVRDADRYRMWYSIRSRSKPYHIGYAESPDGSAWTRRDGEVGIVRSDSGWDSEMICYPAVIDVGRRRLMFYNGNRHGSSGFGVAVLEEG